MNFIITTNCNKGCSFCFASQNRQEYGVNTMDLDTFKSLLDKLEKTKDPHVKLLGGEPTIHPQFPLFLDEVEKRKLPITIISNFLFSGEIKERIIELIENVNVSFLVNASDLNESTIEKWSKNYTDIYKYMYNFDLEERISCGYTFEEDKDWRYYVKYTDYLLNHIPKIERLRLSLNFPGSKKDKENFYFIDNKRLGEKFLIMTKKAMDIGAKPAIDCIVYPCMFDNKEEFKFIKKFSEGLHTKCNTSPFDVFPNKKGIYCYPLSTINVNTTGRNLDEAREILMNKYKDAHSKIILPEKCVECSFLGKECDGPCLGFFNLEAFNE